MENNGQHHIPEWARKALGYLLAFALAYIAAKWGIVPYPQEDKASPKIIILQPTTTEVKLVH